MGRASDERSEYQELFQQLRDSVSHLSSAEPGDTSPAKSNDCANLMKSLVRFEQLALSLGHDHTQFIEGCRWHFERHPQYLSVQTQFGSYRNFIQEKGGPLWIPTWG